ncbi:Cytochrome P450 71B31 [Arabidopsis thaliana]
MVVFSSNEAAKEVLKTHDLETCNRPKLVANGLFTHGYKDIGFTQYGEEWREMKKYIREEEGDLLVKKISKYAQTQTLVDLRKSLFSYTASIIFREAFGQNFRECDFINMDKLEELVQETETNVCSLAFTDFFPRGLGWLVDRISGQHSRMNIAFSKLTTFFEDVIDELLKTKQLDDHSDLVTAMLDVINRPTEFGSLKITYDHLIAMMSDVVLAGVNAGTVSMIWTMTELTRHPRVMKKLQREIRATFEPNKERITEEDLEKVEYLNLVIKESFRLHPPAPLLLPRETMSNIEIQGYHIPKNAHVKINTYAIGRDPKRWTNPEEFNPERFLNTSINYKGQHYELLPFGAGRRNCPGMTLGITILELGLLNILYYFDWSLPSGMTIKDIDMEEEGALNIAKKVPLQLVPTLP